MKVSHRLANACPLPPQFCKQVEVSPSRGWHPQVMNNPPNRAIFKGAYTCSKMLHVTDRFRIVEIFHKQQQVDFGTNSTVWGRVFKKSRSIQPSLPGPWPVEPFSVKPSTPCEGVVCIVCVCVCVCVCGCVQMWITCQGTLCVCVCVCVCPSIDLGIHYMYTHCTICVDVCICVCVCVCV